MPDTHNFKEELASHLHCNPLVPSEKQHGGAELLSSQQAGNNKGTVPERKGQGPDIEPKVLSAHTLCFTNCWAFVS